MKFLQFLFKRKENRHKQSAKFLSILFILGICFVLSANSQTTDIQNEKEIEVPILRQFGSRYSHCYEIENKVIDQQTLEKIKQDEKCSQFQALNVDFEKQTLIAYEARGDCFIHASAKVFRNDGKKTYTVRINNYWGKCRAGGSFQGWLVIDKIPSDYKVEFLEFKIDDAEVSKNSFLTTSTRTNKTPDKFIETREADLKGCIQMYQQKQFVIGDRETYLQNIRRDAQKESCIENAKNLDFEKYTFLGIQINSGYCRRPLGLEHQLEKDNLQKQYTLQISYIDPGFETCRALSRFDLWLAVPKLSKDYELKFDVRARDRN